VRWPTCWSVTCPTMSWLPSTFGRGGWGCRARPTCGVCLCARRWFSDVEVVVEDLVWVADVFADLADAQYVELDDGNVPHVTRYGVTLTEVETMLLTATRFARNKRSRAGDYVAVGNGIRVNFIYQPKDHTARPISAWRL
jgi:hypothetical protein